MGSSMTAINLGTIGSTGPDDFARTHSKRNGPATSQDAAGRAQRFASGHCKLIMASMQMHGPQTAKEVASTTGLSSVQVSRRSIDMQSAGLIRTTGQERDGCRVFEVV